MDVKTTFPKVNLDVKIYIIQVEDCVVSSNMQKARKLVKSLYS